MKTRSTQTSAPTTVEEQEGVASPTDSTSGITTDSAVTENTEEVDKTDASLNPESDIADLADADPYEKYVYLRDSISFRERTLERVSEILGAPTRETEAEFIWDFEDESGIALGKSGSWAYSATSFESF